MAYFEKVKLTDEDGNTINPSTDESQQDMIMLLTRMLNYLSSPQGYDKTVQRQRGAVIIESGTITSVSSVVRLADQTNIGGIQAQIPANGQNLAAWALNVRARIT
jgi:hypothetical protein